MSWAIIGLAAGTLFSMGLVLTYILGWADRAFHVEVDPREEKIMEALPGANCGGCGYPGCSNYAAAVASGSAAVDKCVAGGDSCTAELAEIMGIEASAGHPVQAVVHCGASTDDRLQKSEYWGEKSCTAANLTAGVQGCIFGCLGFGDCEKACDFDAIHVIDGLSTVDYDKCVGCGACTQVCPRNIISLNTFKRDQLLVVACSNKDPGPEVKRVCKVGCMGCKACARTSGLFKIENNLSSIDYEALTIETLPEAINAAKKCPRSRLTFVGKGGSSIPDLEKLEPKDFEKVATADFKTTVDETEWRG